MLTLHIDAQIRRFPQLACHHSCVTEDGIDQRRLSGPVGPGETDDLTPLHRERHRADDGCAIAGDNAVEFEQWRNDGH
jgi:hypothetical protein